MKIQGTRLTGIRVKDIDLVYSGLTMQLDAATYTSGTTWQDLSPNNADITLVNSPTHTSGAPSYFTFNSSSSQSGTGLTNNVLPTTAYTKSIWFYLNSLTDNNLISSEGGGHFMYLGGTNKIYCGHTDWPGYNLYASTASFSTGNWYYAALTFNTTDGMTLYVNGTLDSTYTAIKSAHTGTGTTNIGRFGAGNFLNGRIGQVFCYNRSLSAAEIAQNYNSTRTRYGL